MFAWIEFKETGGALEAREQFVTLLQNHTGLVIRTRRDGKGDPLITSNHPFVRNHGWLGLSGAVRCAGDEHRVWGNKSAQAGNQEIRESPRRGSDIAAQCTMPKSRVGPRPCLDKAAKPGQEIQLAK